MKHRSLLIILLLLLFLAAWIPRVIALDAFVSPDEPRWLTRSANFYQALSEGNLADTYQREHPGVTVMWAGTLGFLSYFPSYPEQTPGPFHPDETSLEQFLREREEISALQLLVAGRWWMTVWIALTLPIGFLLLCKLFDARVALLATFWVAWDPFYMALSRQLHLDGLVSSLIFLSLLCFLLWLDGRRRSYFLWLSAFLMGLGWLTKAPAVVLLPFCVLLVFFEWRRTSYAMREMRLLIWSLVTWGIIALLTFVALWPALWVAPIDTLSKMVTAMQYYASSGHGNGNYFLGEITSDPGVLFYPVHYLFRITPLTFFGLGVGVFWWRSHDTRVVGPLVTFALFFTLFISFIAKQNDRYLLPIFLPLDVVAVWGWSRLLKWLEEKMPSLAVTRYSLATPFLGVLLLLHALPGLLHAPYYFTYYNSLFGGLNKASSLLTVGWGEGLEKAAAWLNEQPNPNTQRVLSWYDNGPFSYYFQGIPGSLTEDWNAYGWCDTKFGVTYINQWQRHLPHEEAHAYFAQLTPIHRIEHAGIELARIYDMQNIELPFYGNDEHRADFGEKIRLAAYEFEREETHSGIRSTLPGERFRVKLKLQSLVPMETNYNVLTRLVAPDGREVWRDEGWPWGAPTSDWDLCDVREDGHEIVIPDDAPTGMYAFMVSFYNPTTFESLPITEVNQQIPIAQSERMISLMRVGPPPEIEQSLTPAPQFGTVALLRGITLPENISAGTPLKLRLLWESVTSTPFDYTTFVHIVDANGAIVSQQDRPPLNGFVPTSRWQPSETVFDEYTLELPPELPTGDYMVRIGFYTLEEGRLPVSIDGSTIGDTYEVGHVRVPNE